MELILLHAEAGNRSMATCGFWVHIQGGGGQGRALQNILYFCIFSV